MVTKLEIFAYVKGPEIKFPEQSHLYVTKMFRLKYTFKQCLKKMTFQCPMCFGVYFEEKLIHSCYLFSNLFSAFLLGYIGYSVIGGCFTIDEFKGKGIYPNTLRQIAHTIGGKLVVFVACSNEGSIRGIEKAGYILDNRFVLYRIGRLTVYRKKVDLRILSDFDKK